MLREDSDEPFWKEKFINGLPANLFAHKIRQVPFFYVCLLSHKKRKRKEKRLDKSRVMRIPS
jgi:hypothetical protein